MCQYDLDVSVWGFNADNEASDMQKCLLVLEERADICYNYMIYEYG